MKGNGRSVFIALSIILTAFFCMPLSAGDYDELNADVRKTLSGGDSFKAIESIEAFGGAEESGKAYARLVMDFYWEDKNLDAAIFLGHAGIQHCLTKAAGTGDEEARKLRELARSISYNLASFTWPGWDEPGIEIGRNEIQTGLDAAILNLRLVRELGEGPKKESTALWSVGAQYLALGDYGKAVEVFDESQTAAAEAGLKANELLAMGYGGITLITEGDRLEKGFEQYRSALEGFNELGTEDARAYAGQLKNVLRYFRFRGGKIAGIDTIEDLDGEALFSFAIMSDNKGDAPMDKEPFDAMTEWIEDSGDRFVIGLGDHVKKGWDNNFLAFLDKNTWWSENFYPNIADGENEYYGTGQSDWGAGGRFLKETKLRKRDNVEVRDNGTEYYAKIRTGDYTVHLIQLHYPDQPYDDEQAFTEDSREYLMETLASIEKGPRDIVVAAAHSRTGSWIDVLSDEQRKQVMEKADLVLSATTHFFERYQVEGYENSGALCINTGSITYPRAYCPSGYVQVHVLSEPQALVVQYLNAGRGEREMQHGEYAFIKAPGGKIYETDFREPRMSENMDLAVGFINKEYSREETAELVKSIFAEATGADHAFVKVTSGMDTGEVTLEELWSLFPFNNEIYVLDLTDAEVKKMFQDRIPVGDSERIKLAINGYNAEFLIDKLELPDERIEKTDMREMDVMKNWAERQ